MSVHIRSIMHMYQNNWPLLMRKASLIPWGEEEKLSTVRNVLTPYWILVSNTAAVAEATVLVVLRFIADVLIDWSSSSYLVSCLWASILRPFVRAHYQLAKAGLQVRGSNWFHLPALLMGSSVVMNVNLPEVLFITCSPYPVVREETTVTLLHHHPVSQGSIL